MGYILRLALILMVITGVAAASLALVNKSTRPIIEDYKRRQEEKARAEVMKEGIQYQECQLKEGRKYYRVFADEEAKEFIGYIFTAAGKGYSSTIQTVTGIDTTFNIVGIKIIFQQETPGLGAKCQEIKYGEDSPWFQRNFFKSQREVDRKIPFNALNIKVGEGDNKVHAITGATITTRAITNSIKEFANALKTEIDSVETAVEEEL